jgi:hypothetical protein
MKSVILDAHGVFHATIRGKTFSKSDFKKTSLGLSLSFEQMRVAYLGHLLMYAGTRVGRSVYNENVVVAIDHPPYWRTEIFPGYKCTRAKKREDDEFDWKDLFATYEKVLEDIKANVPWRFIRIPTLEADDVIGILAPRFASNGGKTLIVSGDGDLVQLQRYDGVVQFSPRTKKFIKPVISPFHDLMEKVIKGDAGDAIPNIHSPSDHYIRKMQGEDVGTQKPITKKTLDLLRGERYTNIKDVFPHESLIGFKRNVELVDLSKVPSHLVDLCIKEYTSYVAPSMSDFQKYLVTNRMKNILERSKEFYAA